MDPRLIVLALCVVALAAIAGLAYWLGQNEKRKAAEYGYEMARLRAGKAPTAPPPPAEADDEAPRTDVMGKHIVTWKFVVHDEYLGDTADMVQRALVPLGLRDDLEKILDLKPNADLSGIEAKYHVKILKVESGRGSKGSKGGIVLGDK